MQDSFEHSWPALFSMSYLSEAKSELETAVSNETFTVNGACPVAQRHADRLAAKLTLMNYAAKVWDVVALETSQPLQLQTYPNEMVFSLPVVKVNNTILDFVTGRSYSQYSYLNGLFVKPAGIVRLPKSISDGGKTQAKLW